MLRKKKLFFTTTRTQLTLLNQQRKQFEDAIAVLLGKSAPDYHVGPRDLAGEPPALNAGLPSDLLERRPTSPKPNVKWPSPTRKSESRRPLTILR